MPPKKSGANNPRTPKAAHASQTPWSTPPPSGGASGSGDSIHPAPESAYDIQEPQGGVKSDNHVKPQDAPMTPKYPVSPPKSPTPKSPTPRSPPAGGSVITAFTTQTGAAHNVAVAKDVEAVEELLSTMKLTLSALGSTLDTLGEQTLHVAALGPAIDANHQVWLTLQCIRSGLRTNSCASKIGAVRKQLEDQHKRQEQRMVEVKAMLKEEVLDGQLQEKLKEIAAVVVKEIVRKHVVERVRKEVSHN